MAAFLRLRVMPFPDEVFRSFLEIVEQPVLRGALRPASSSAKPMLAVDIRSYLCALVLADGQSLALCCGSVAREDSARAVAYQHAPPAEPVAAVDVFGWRDPVRELLNHIDLLPAQPEPVS